MTRAEDPRASVGLVVVAALVALLHGLTGCTPIMPATTTPVNNITLTQGFYVGCDPQVDAAGETSASDESATAGADSVAISNDVWIAGTTARGESEAANTVPVQVSAQVPISTGGAASTGAQSPSQPARPEAPR